MPLVSSIAWGAFAVIEKYESDQCVRKPTTTRAIFFVPKHHATYTSKTCPSEAIVWGENKMNCACVVLSSFKREREDVRSGVWEGKKRGERGPGLLL